VANISSRGTGRRTRRWAVGSLLLAAAAIAPLLVLTSSAGAGKHRVSANGQFLKATYVPIKLRAPGDPQEVRYDISCLPPDGNAEGAGVCDGGGTVYFRSNTNVVVNVPLRLDPSAEVGRYVATVPARIWNSPWFSYYAVIRDDTSGRTITVPEGGSSAPQLSFAMDGSTVDLGDHLFGATRAASARVAAAGWGSGADQVGLEDGIDMPTGAASFDVDASGNVYLLDEANARLLEFVGASDPADVPLPGLAGVRADLRVDGGTGTAYLLEVSNAASVRPQLRAYSLQGTAIGSSDVADAAAAQIQLSRSTAYVSEYPSSMWAPVLENDGRTAVGLPFQLATCSS
jgi:hypothetical protein